MSVFFKHNFTICKFKSSDSNWVILSSIKQRIKEKVEKKGIPLAKWDIQIRYGLKTGCNEAFIISTKKRNEILNNCLTTNEKNITAELIRPILRGKDISTYSINWANLWLINIPSGYTKILMSELVEVKTPEQFMKDNFYGIWKNFIEYINFEKSKINKKGKGINKRDDQGNYWWELRSCSYLDDFAKPKIIYPNMTKFLPFVLDDKEYYTNQKCFIITGNNLGFITAFLNSSIFKFCYRDSFPELQGGTRELSKVFFQKIPIISITPLVEMHFEKLVKDIQFIYSVDKAIAIDKAIFKIYDLTEDEQNHIGFVKIL